jgi:hypothetical protein
MSNINTGRWLLSRRHALQALGTSIALPLLNCMVPLHAGAERPRRTRRRSVFIYVPNGVQTLTWQIETAGRDFHFTPSMEALARHRQEVTPISGLHHPNGLGTAHRCDQIWLTGASLAEEHRPFRNTVSADQLLAEATAVDTRYPSLQLAATKGTLAWTRQGVALPAERRPSVLFDLLFTPRKSGVAEERRRLVRHGSILDLVLDEAHHLQRKVGVEDHTKLDEYLQAVREVEARTERADAWLGIPKPSLSPDHRGQLDLNATSSQPTAYYRTLYDLMALALLTDQTRAITCMTGSESHGPALPDIGIPKTRHELSHHNGDPQNMEELTRADAYLVEQFAYFLDRLQEYTEAGEPLLARTLVLFGSGMS